MIANLKSVRPAKVCKSLFKCLGKILHKTPETLKESVQHLLTEDENIEINDEAVFDALAENENMTLNVYINNNNNNESQQGGVNTYGNNCDKVINIYNTEKNWLYEVTTKKREIDIKNSIKHRVHLNISDDYNVLFNITQDENDENTNISNNHNS